VEQKTAIVNKKRRPTNLLDLFEYYNLKEKKIIIKPNDVHLTNDT
jgi:hypothetical protein